MLCVDVVERVEGKTSIPRSIEGHIGGSIHASRAALPGDELLVVKVEEEGDRTAEEKDVASVEAEMSMCREFGWLLLSQRRHHGRLRGQDICGVRKRLASSETASRTGDER